MTTLRLALIKGPVYDPFYQRLDLFSRTTGINTEVVWHLPWHELLETLQANYASSQPEVPIDLVTSHSKYAPSMRHFLQPLDDLLIPQEIASFTAAAIDFARIDGLLYALPRNFDVRVLVYRSDLVTAVPATWDELVTSAVRLADPPHDRSGFVFTGKMSGLFGSFYELLASAGGQLLDREFRPAFVSSQGEWALETLRRLYKEAATAEMADYSYDEVAFAFRDGRCAMYTEWPGFWSLITDPGRSKVLGRMGVAVYPSGPTGRKVYAGSHTFAITSSTRDLPASLELLRFLTSDESLLTEARIGSLVPKPSVLKTVIGEAAPNSIEATRWQALQTTMENYSLLPPKMERWPVVEDTLWPALRQGYMGELDIRRALERAAEEITAALAVAA
jgi:multiple sugar transport system substrate-binding protein